MLKLITGELIFLSYKNDGWMNNITVSHKLMVGAFLERLSFPQINVRTFVSSFRANILSIKINNGNVEEL